MATNNIDRPQHAILYWLIASLASLVVFLLFLTNPGMHTNPKAFLSMLVYQRAYKPPVYRTLLPTTVGLLSRIVPEAKRSELALEVLEHHRFTRLMLALHLEPAYPVESLIALVLIYASLWGFMIVLLRLFDVYYTAPTSFRMLVPTLGILGLPPLFAYTNYPYDFCTLFFPTLAILLIAQRRWRVFLLVFVLACLNKETSILITLIFAFYWYFSRFLPKEKFVKLFLGQIAIFVVLKLTLSLRFWNNPGTLVEFHLEDHNLRVVRQWMEHGYHLTGLVVFLLLMGALFHSWKTKPLLLRCGLIILPPMFALSIFFGYLDEWRVYFDAYSVVFLLVLEPAGRLFGLRLREETIQQIPANP